MNHYKNILAAIDISKEAYVVAERAQSVAQHHGSNLHLIHVLQPLNFAYSGDAVLEIANIQMELENQAKKQLLKIAAHFYIPEAHQHLIIGSAATEIHALSDKLSADLLVIGTHGRSGLSLLLGSTANSVLHGSTCDVLAVRIGKK